MNRSHAGGLLHTSRKPHIRGDEPAFDPPLESGWRKPHIRGDEPMDKIVVCALFGVNPTYVGMNREISPNIARHLRKPHIRGDEPETGQMLHNPPA